jgi:hypothetical protein
VRPAVTTRAKIAKPEFDPVKLEQFARRLGGVDDVWFAARSPKRVHNVTPASFLHHLYVPGECVLIFDTYKSQGQALWRHEGFPFDARELDMFRKGKRCGVWFQAAPVTGVLVEDGRLNKDGTPHLSRRSHRTVTSFRWAVLESDKAGEAHWLAFLAQSGLPIAAIYSSGAASIHALIRVNAGSKEEWDSLIGPRKAKLITMGADRKTLSAVRLTRLPCCERLGKELKDGSYFRFPKPQMQRLIYLNPWVDETPICELPGLPYTTPIQLTDADDSGVSVEGGWL